MSYTTKYFALRTVTNGRVKIGGKVFAPSIRDNSLPYDGRLEGMCLAFGRYMLCDEYRPFVNLWGTARDFRIGNCEQWVDYPGPNVIDGVIHWMFWDEVTE